MALNGLRLRDTNGQHKVFFVNSSSWFCTQTPYFLRLIPVYKHSKFHAPCLVKKYINGQSVIEYAGQTITCNGSSPLIEPLFILKITKIEEHETTYCILSHMAVQHTSTSTICNNLIPLMTSRTIHCLSKQVH